MKTISNYQDEGIRDVVFPNESTEKKRHLSKDNDEGTVKRRRVLSFAEDIVDDSEGEDDDFLLTGIEGIGNTLETKDTN